MKQFDYVLNEPSSELNIYALRNDIRNFFRR